MSPSPAVIFDFDGTIADSREVVLAQYNKMAPRLRVRPVQRSELEQLQRLPPKEALRAYGVAWWKLPLLVFAVRRGLREEVLRIAVCEGVRDVLDALSAKGVRCSVLSTNSTDNIERFAKHHRLPAFSAVRGGVSMFGKARALDRFVREQRLDKDRVVYVGDEVRDVEAASSIGVCCVAVSWGFSHRDALAAKRPWRLVDTASELASAIDL